MLTESVAYKLEELVLLSLQLLLWCEHHQVYQFSSVQFSCSVMSYSLQSHELRHARPPCPSPTPGVHPNSCPSSRWCHPAISSSVVPFSSCPQSLPASGSFPVSQIFAWVGQVYQTLLKSSFSDLQIGRIRMCSRAWFNLQQIHLYTQQGTHQPGKM